MNGVKHQAQLELEAMIAAMNQGRDYYKQQPNLMLVEVARHAATLLAVKQYQIAFLQGYSQARAQHEEFLMESDR
jgi:hypothetical protein